MKVVLKDLTKRFKSRVKGGPDVIAVNDFDFEIPDGQLVALLGARKQIDELAAVRGDHR